MRNKKIACEMLQKKLVALNKLIMHLNGVREEQKMGKEIIDRFYLDESERIRNHYETEMAKITNELEELKEEEMKIRAENDKKLEKLFKRMYNDLDIVKHNKENITIVERKVEYLSKTLEPVLVSIASLNKRIGNIDSIVTHMEDTIEEQKRTFKSSLADADSKNLEKIKDLIKKNINNMKMRLFRLNQLVVNSQNETVDCLNNVSDFISHNKTASRELILVKIKEEFGSFIDGKIKNKEDNLRLKDEQRNAIRELNDAKAQNAMKHSREIKALQSLIEYDNCKYELIVNHIKFTEEILSIIGKFQTAIDSAKNEYSYEYSVAYNEINELIQEKQAFSNELPSENLVNFRNQNEYLALRDEFDMEYSDRITECEKIIEDARNEFDNEEKEYMKELKNVKDTIKCLITQFDNPKLDPQNPNFEYLAQLELIKEDQNILKRKITHDKNSVLNQIETQLQDEKYEYEELQERKKSRSNPFSYTSLQEKLEKTKKENELLIEMRTDFNQLSNQLVKARNRTYNNLNNQRKTIEDEKKIIQIKKVELENDFKKAFDMNQAVIKDLESQLNAKKINTMKIVDAERNNFKTIYSQRKMQLLHDMEEFVKKYEQRKKEIKKEEMEDSHFEIVNNEEKLKGFQEMSEHALGQRYDRLSNNIDLLDKRIMALEKQNFIMMQIVNSDKSEFSSKKIGMLEKKLNFMNGELAVLISRRDNMKTQIAAYNKADNKLSKTMNVAQSVKIMTPNLKSNPISTMK